MASSGDQEEYKLLTKVEDARKFIMSCFQAVGTPKKHAEIATDVLIEADTRGYYSHGMNRLGNYIRDIKNKMVDPAAEPTIAHETICTAVVDGHNGLGMVVGTYSMKLAIQKAKQYGVSLVVARGSNHFGIAGYYPHQCVKNGIICISVTNTFPLMVPTRAKKAALGTNPIALGAPGVEEDCFLLDMTTTAVALGKLEMHRRNGQPLPSGWAVNEKGEIETNPEVALKYKCLTPLGGTEESGAYKGFGLAIFVEIISGLLSGSAYGPKIGVWGEIGEFQNLGHGYLAIDPSFFEPGFKERLSDLLDIMRKLEPLNPEKPVAVPGDGQRSRYAQIMKDGGIFYVQNQHETNLVLAKELKVKPLKSKRVKIKNNDNNNSKRKSGNSSGLFSCFPFNKKKEF